MSFEAVIQEVCSNLQISREDRISYLRDMQTLSNFIMDEMKSSSCEFKEYFDGLSLTGSYLDRLKIKTPDEFDFHLKLAVKHLRPALSNEPGYINLRTCVKHDFVIGNLMNRVSLQNWLRAVFESIFRAPLTHNCNGRTYKLKYTQKGVALAHTITAIDINNKHREISFDFVPAFEFDNSDWPYTKKISERSWFAVPGPPVGDDNSFQVCAPHWEAEMIYNKVHMKDALRLMKAMRDTQELWRLSSYMLKSLFMHAIGNTSERFWSQSVGAIVVEMLQRLVNCFEMDALPFYWQPNIDLFERINFTNKYNYRNKLQNIVQMLKNAQKTNAMIDRNQILSIFI